MDKFEIDEKYKNTKMSKKELSTLLKTAHGIAEACEKDNLSEKLTHDIVLMTLRETAKEIVANRK